MPHVDEGTLHALLDGALRAEDPARADAVEGHLDACPDCRARLEEAAALKDRSAGILAALEPSAATPDFDEVLARREGGAGTRGPSGGTGGADDGGLAARGDGEPAVAPGDRAARVRRARRVRRLAWAASFIVALGTGYLVGERFGVPAGGAGADRAALEEASPRGAESSGPSGPSGPAARELGEAEEAGVRSPRADASGRVADGAGGESGIATPPAERAPAGATRGAQPPTAVATPDRDRAPEPAEVAAARALADASAADAGGAGEAAEREGGRAEAAEAARAEAAPAPPDTSLFPGRIALESIVVTGVTADERGVPADQAGNVTGEAAVGRPAGVEAAPADDAPGAWRPVDADGARRVLDGPLLRLPGATVRDLRVAVAPVGDAVHVRSRQVLSGGEVVEVTQTRRGAEETAPNDAAAGASPAGEARPRAEGARKALEGAPARAVPEAEAAAPAPATPEPSAGAARRERLRRADAAGVEIRTAVVELEAYTLTVVGPLPAEMLETLARAAVPFP